MKKVLFTATVDSHILHFHIPYLKWFKEQGYEVHVATNGEEQIPYCDVKHKISFERSPIKINNLKAIKQLKKIIDEEKFNIIHCHTPMGSVVTRIAAMKSRKENRTRVIYTAHGFHFFKGAPIQNWLIFYPIEKILSYVTDCLITINEEDYNLAKKKFKAKQIELVHGVGVDENKFNFEMTNEEKHSLRQELDLNDDDFVMIYPAELSKRKNQGMLLQIMKMLKDEGHNNIKLLLPGKDSMNGKYQQMAKDLEINENVKFLGYRKDIPKLMKISDLAVSTAKQEGLPVNLIEAMMCDLPIVATDCRGNRDLVRDTISIKDIRKFKQKIEKEEYSLNNEKDTKKYELSNIKKYMEKIYIEMEKNRKKVFFMSNIFVDDISVGITKKVIAQMEALNELGYTVEYYTGYTKEGAAIYNKNNEIVFTKRYPTKNEKLNRILRNQVLKKMTYNFFNNEKVTTEIVYMRFLYFDYNFLKLIKKLKKQNKTTVIEAHAFPIHSKKISIYSIVDFIDICYTNLVKKYIDVVVAISDRKNIWGRTTINIDNGVNIKEITVKENKETQDNIKMIVVANEYNYHGYDRLIKGLKEYYKDEKNKTKVTLEMVGQYLPSTINLVKEFQLNKYVNFYGKKYGKELDDIYDKSNIAIGALAHHRIGAYYGSSLKTKEYFAKGIPFVYGWKEPAFDENYKYAYKIDLNETPININDILKFYDRIKDDNDTKKNMREFAEKNYTWKVQMNLLTNFLEGENI